MSASDSEIRAAESELRRGFQTLEVFQKNPGVPVYHIYLNRPTHRNALSLPFFSELQRALTLLSIIPSARTIVLAGRGSNFCSGIDLGVFHSFSPSDSADTAVASNRLRGMIVSIQAAVSSLERCSKPVIAAIHGACIGGGVDLAAACDIRCCSDDAYFAVKEVDLALAADLGSLQRLPRIIGYGNAADLSLTCRRVSATEAKSMGLVSRVFPSPPELEEGVDQLAKELSEKSALAVMGTKAVLLKSRDQTVDDGLDYVATWNSSMLMSRDIEEALSAHLQRRRPNFSKL